MPVAGPRCLCGSILVLYMVCLAFSTSCRDHQFLESAFWGLGRSAMAFCTVLLGRQKMARRQGAWDIAIQSVELFNIFVMVVTHVIKLDVRHPVAEGVTAIIAI